MTRYMTTFLFCNDGYILSHNNKLSIISDMSHLNNIFKDVRAMKFHLKQHQKVNDTISSEKYDPT